MACNTEMGHFSGVCGLIHLVGANAPARGMERKVPGEQSASGVAAWFGALTWKRAEFELRLHERRSAQQQWPDSGHSLLHHAGCGRPDQIGVVHLRCLASLAQAQTLNQTGSGTWNLQWTYDRFGNRLSQGGTGNGVSIGQPNFTIDAGTNRIVGYCYDAAGNLTDEGAVQRRGRRTATLMTAQTDLPL
jgi:hypothetical protein